MILELGCLLYLLHDLDDHVIYRGILCGSLCLYKLKESPLGIIKYVLRILTALIAFLYYLLAGLYEPP